MARTNSYRKAEVLEVLEADEGGNEVELESPLSPSSTGSEDDSEASIESPRKKVKMSERQVVCQTTPKKTSTNAGTDESATPLTAIRLKRARSVDHPVAELPDTVRQSNLRAMMDPSDNREPDEFLLSDDFEVRMELLFDESAMSVCSVSSTETMEKIMIMHISTQQKTTTRKPPQDSTSKVKRSIKHESAHRTATSEPSAYRRSKKLLGNTECTVTVINHIVVCERFYDS